MVRLGMSDKPRELRENPFPDFDFDRELRLCYEDFHNKKCNIESTAQYIICAIWLCRPYEALNQNSKLFDVLKIAEKTKDNSYALVMALKKYLNIK